MTLRWVGRLSLLVAALVSMFVVRSLQPTSTGVGVFLGIWLLLPYAVLGVILARSSPANDLANVITTLLVAAGGMLFLILVVVVSPDPQGGIAVLFTPVYQSIAASVLLVLTRWLFRRNAGGEGG